MSRSRCFKGIVSCLLAIGCGQKANGPSDSELECGVNDSCAKMLAVPRGTFNRSNDARFPATLGNFGLEKYEVTVGRFRQFVQAFNTWRESGHPVLGEGAHPAVSSSGWQASWPLAASEEQLTRGLHCNPKSETWTDAAGARENWPINCVNWYEAFAFCAWNSSRLPTEAEWNFAAAGGDEQRKYPWGDEEPGTDTRLAIYGCYHSSNHRCELADIAKVGSAPDGNGRFGHSDLAGNVWEWTMDGAGDYPSICENCAAELAGTNAVIRGGSFYNQPEYLLSATRLDSGVQNRGDEYGFRCASSDPDKQ